MRRPFVNKVLMTIIVVLSCAFCLSCTGKNKQDPDLNDGPEPTYIDDPKEPDITSIDVPNDDTPASRLGYYTVNSRGVLVRATSIISGKSKVTPQLITEYVLDSLEDESIILETESITVEDSDCIISFTDSIYDIAAEGLVLETAVLDAISQSILDNIESVAGIIFRINGEAYSTKNLSFKIDAVYMGN